MPKPRLGHAIVLGLAVGAVAAAGCARGGLGSGSPGDGPAAEETSGKVSMQLTVDPGVVLDALSYTITGPNAFSRSRTIDVSRASGLLFTEGVLPAGGPYTISITATSVDGTVSCAGMGTFTIVAGATVGVSVPLQCHKAKTKGSVVVDGSIDVCPNIDGIDTNPQETTVGYSVLLTSLASDADPGNTITYSWTATSGTLESPSAPATHFTCTAAGTVLVTLDVTDGICGDQLTLPVVCDNPLDSGSVQVDAGVLPGICPSIDGIEANPQETTVGHSVLLSASASSFDPGATITYAWSAPSGTFDTLTAADVHFTCTTRGLVTVTLTIADGSGCGDSLPIDVQCD